MPLDVDFVIANDAINVLKKLLSDLPHGEREGISEDLMAFTKEMCEKWKTS